mgnify:CR=1 FL=1
MEDQARPRIRRDAEGEAGREDDQAGADGHKGVQHTDAGGLAGQGVVAGHIAAEDFHGADAQAEGEEGLVHGCHNDIADALLHGAVPVRQQVEGQALARAGQGQAVHGQHNNEHQQRDHHPFADALQPLLQAEAADDKTGNDGKHHPEAHLHRVGQHLAEHLGHLVGVQPLKGAGKELDKVADHPAVDGGVIHHQHNAADQAGPAVPVPFGAGRLQFAVGGPGAGTAGAAHRQLHGQNGDAHADQGQQIEQHKHTAAVFAGDGGEPPHIADADGAARADQDKAQPGLEVFSFHTKTLLFPVFPQNSGAHGAGPPLCATHLLL